MRVRKSHKKARSGCTQCKARRVKCDETKSKCVKCTMRNIPCSFDDDFTNPQRPASFPTDLQGDSVRKSDPAANDPLAIWDLAQSISERGGTVPDFLFPPVDMEFWLSPCWNIQNLSLPNVGLLPALQSDPVLTAANMEDSVWNPIKIMLPTFQSSFQDSTALAGDFSSKPEGVGISLESLCQLPKDPKWEDLLVFPPSPAAATEKPILVEPNIEVNLESESDQDTERTSPHGAKPTQINCISDQVETWPPAQSSTL